MNLKLLIGALVFGLVCIALFAVVARLTRRKKTLNKVYFTEKWKEAQKCCGKKETWPLAVINADKLLDEALKKSRYKGKTMGERLVAAQHDLSDNDSVWFGHKLRNRLVHESNVSLKEDDIREAMAGIRQALRDLGALQK
jgi:hypothetical protein